MITRLGLVLFALTTTAVPAGAVCIPFYCDECELLSAGQLNLVLRDPGAGTITLIPNIRIQGAADDFAILVPTPTEPQLNPVSADLWQQTLQLTRPVPVTRRNTSCSATDIALNAPTTDSGDAESGVDVLGSQTVGAFVATLLRSDDPEALASWLEDEGYGVTPEDAELLAPYIEREWFFTAMKLDPTQVTIPTRWDANVDPVAFTYEADAFELPLPLLTIHMASFLPVEVFSIDDHRVTLPGFSTRYANRLSTAEVDAIRRAHPALSDYVTPGRFLTRLHRDFRPGDDMSTSPNLTRTRSDDEFRWGNAAFPVELLVGGLLLGWGRRRARRAA